MAKRKPPRPQRPGRKITTLIVRRRPKPEGLHQARLHAGPVTIRAAVGKAGFAVRKREGDGATPVGRFILKQILFRADRVSKTVCVGSRPLRPTMGWCDDAASFRYNQPVPAGSACSHEKLWRDDGVYDVIVPTSHNQRPRVRGAGSAIFFHLARPGYDPTEGCVAISLPDMRRLLPRLGRTVRLVIAR